MAVSKVQPKVTFTTPVQAPKGALKTSAAKKEVTTATPSAAKTIAKYAVAALAVSAAAYGANAAYRAYTVAPSFFQKASDLMGLGLVVDAANGVKNFVVNNKLTAGATTAAAAAAIVAGRQFLAGVVKAAMA